MPLRYRYFSGFIFSDQFRLNSQAAFVWADYVLELKMIFIQVRSALMIEMLSECQTCKTICRRILRAHSFRVIPRNFMVCDDGLASDNRLFKQ
jgi:hypothetical protein